MTNNFLSLHGLKRLNFVYLGLITLSVIFDLTFLTLTEASGNLIFLTVFLLVAIYPTGGQISKILLYFLLVISSVIGVYVIYVNIFGGDSTIDLVFRIGISVVWVLNIVYYVITFMVISKYNEA